MATIKGLIDFNTLTGLKKKVSSSKKVPAKKNTAPGAKLASYSNLGFIKQSSDYASTPPAWPITRISRRYKDRNLYSFTVPFLAKFKTLPHIDVNIIGLHHDKDHNTFFEIWNENITQTSFICNILLSENAKGAKFEVKVLGYAIDGSYPPSRIPGTPNDQFLTILE